MRIQVTYFQCGGISIAFSIYHILVDGTATFEMINNWANFHCKKPYFVQPHFDRSRLLSNKQPPAHEHPEFFLLPVSVPKPTTETKESEIEKQLENEIEKPVVLKPPQPAVKMFHISNESLTKLKQKGTDESDKSCWISTNDALIALVWKHVTKAKKISEEESTALGMACNARSKFNPPLPEGYFGNVNFYIYSRTTVANLLNADFPSLTKQVRDAVNKITPEHVQSSLNYVGCQTSGFQNHSELYLLLRPGSHQLE